MGVLVLLSLVLITAYFRESDEGGLHDAQGAVASVLRPFQIGAERVSRPFRDAYGYFSDLFAAKSDADRWRRQAQALKQRAIEAADLRRQNDELKAALNYVRSPAFPEEYDYVVTSVIAQPLNYDQTLTIDAGVTAGVRRGDAVVTPDGLVGIVSLAHRNVAKVQLLTDESSRVSAADQRSGARGIVRHSGGPSGWFYFDVDERESVRRGDWIVTAGWRLGALTPRYPKGRPIGVVTHVLDLDTETEKRVQVEPFVDFSKLDTVIVMTKKDGAEP